MSIQTKFRRLFLTFVTDNQANWRSMGGLLVEGGEERIELTGSMPTLHWNR